MKEPLKVGDRVRVYSHVIFTSPRYGVGHVNCFDDDVVLVYLDKGTQTDCGKTIVRVHPKQCRRLKPRVKVWPQYDFDSRRGPDYVFTMSKEDFNRLSPKQKALLGVK